MSKLVFNTALLSQSWFSGLSVSGRFVWLAVASLGQAPRSVASLAAELAVSADLLESAISELAGSGLAVCEDGHIWLPNRLAVFPPQNPNMAKSMLVDCQSSESALAMRAAEQVKLFAASRGWDISLKPGKFVRNGRNKNHAADTGISPKCNLEQFFNAQGISANCANPVENPGANQKAGMPQGEGRLSQPCNDKALSQGEGRSPCCVKTAGDVISLAFASHENINRKSGNNRETVDNVSTGKPLNPETVQPSANGYEVAENAPSHPDKPQSVTVAPVNNIKNLNISLSSSSSSPSSPSPESVAALRLVPRPEPTLRDIRKPGGARRSLLTQAALDRLAMPCKGNVWVAVSLEQAREWAGLYPEFDILEELHGIGRHLKWQWQSRKLWTEMPAYIENCLKKKYRELEPGASGQQRHELSPGSIAAEERAIYLRRRRELQDAIAKEFEEKGYPF